MEELPNKWHKGWGRVKICLLISVFYATRSYPPHPAFLPLMGVLKRAPKAEKDTVGQ